MLAEQNQEVVRRLIEEGFNKGNYDALDGLMASGYQEHQFGLSATLQGFKEDIRHLREAFPDLRLEIEDMDAIDDKVWVRLTCQGTNHGPFIGPPTHKSIKVTSMEVCRCENGRIVEHWGVPDRFAILAQLGLLPQPDGEHS
ncbi:MAG: ester cyclase [Anaerolineae bacterium]|nr:ester cyclase [Anaerolineae bacterium]